jgi:hypothetical protein
MSSMKARLRRKQGRKSTGLPFVQLFKFMLRCPAWLALSATAQAAYVRLALRYDGVNNGMLALSVRTLALELNVSQSTARRALIELDDAGFIETVKFGAFARRNRKASEYRLTVHRCDVTGESPTKKFMRSVAPDTIGEVPPMKPWQAEGVGRATWYRRQRAQSDAGETVSRVHLGSPTGSKSQSQSHLRCPRVHQEHRQASHETDDGVTREPLIESNHGGGGGTETAVPQPGAAQTARRPWSTPTLTEVLDPAEAECIRREVGRPSVRLRVVSSAGGRP